MMVQLELSTLFFIRNILARFPLLKYDHFSRHSSSRSRCHHPRIHPSQRPPLAIFSLPGAAAAAPGWAQLCALLRYFILNILNAHRLIFERL